MKSKLFFLIFLLVHSILINAQELLTIENAIKLGLEKNYNILISKNNTQIAKTQNNFGNAGMSPTVSLNANASLANVNSHQEFSSGVIQDKSGASSNNVGSAANVNWNVFDGMRMFAIKKRLNQNEELNTIALKQQIENTIYDIILSYYDIVRINALITAQEQNLSIYEERKKIAALKLEIGSDSKIDYLLVQSDANRIKSDLMQLQLQLINAKVKLNTLLVRSADIDFKTEETITTTYNPTIEELKKSSEKNTAFLISKQNELIVNQTITEARASNLPFIQLNGAYNFTRLESQAGIVFLNKQNGLSAGLSANWLIFNGNKNNRLVKERQINLLNQRYMSEQIKLTVDAIVYINYQSYLTNQKILILETQNLGDAKEILNASLERYKIGKSSFIETKEVQKNLEDTQVRYFNALYNTKKAETELLKTNGGLVK